LSITKKINNFKNWVNIGQPMLNAKETARILTPPIIWQFVRAILRSASYRYRTFEGPFSSWNAAVSHADGWDAPEITERTLKAALLVRDGTAAFERDSIAYDRIAYSPTILAFLFLTVARSGNLNIIDFGGGLGANYFQHIKLIQHLSNLLAVRWNVVERETFAKIGAEQFQTSELRFRSNMPSPAQSAALLFSGSLQYLPEPFALLGGAVSGINIVALDRVLTSPLTQHAIYVQHPDPRTFGPATYPVWCFSRDGLIKWFSERGFFLVEHFTDDPARHFDHCGMLFVRQ
jgi:putative methyltransferase (TIGR04325 family)